MKIIKKIIEELGSDYFVDNQTIPKTFSKYEKWKDKWIPIHSSKNNWLKTKDWERYDMRESIMKTKISNEKLMGYARSLYSAFASPQFIWRTLSSIRNWDDIKYISFQGLKFLSKLADFS